MNTYSVQFDGPILLIVPAEGVPGLWNCQQPNGTWLRDLTISQVADLAQRNNWLIRRGDR